MMFKKRKKKYKSVIVARIKRSVGKAGMVFLVAILVSFSGKMPFTNSYFTSQASTKDSKMEAGYWIPELSMSFDASAPDTPDGDNDFWKTAPCIDLSAKVHGEKRSGTKIYYKFSADGDPITDGQVYDGSCVKIPDGNPTDFEAQAVYADKYSWESNIVTGSWKVDTFPPAVEITAPKSSDELSGTVEIDGTVTDANPDHYWLVIDNADGDQVAGPGTVSKTESFTDKKLLDWDTTSVPDGEYTIKLEARDKAGNKDPDEAPVTSDPGEDGDSVDWIKVKVKNDPDARSVIINEVMWMGSEGKSYDEWIELKNTTDKKIDLSNWRIDKAVNGTGDNAHLEIPHGHSIEAGGYFLISDKGKDDSAMDVTPDLVDTSISFNNTYGTNGQLVLRDKDKNTIDATPIPGSSGADWPKGSNGDVKESMERNDTPGDGTQSSSWHTCQTSEMNDTEKGVMQSYWDDDAKDDNCGTPRHANLSGNDPSSSGESEKEPASGDDSPDAQVPAGSTAQSDTENLNTPAQTDQEQQGEDSSGNEPAAAESPKDESSNDNDTNSNTDNL